MRVAVAAHAGEQFRQDAAFTQQYANVYYARLQLLGPTIKPSAAWGDTPRAPRVLDLVNGRRSWIIGTLYREMAAKPNILDDVREINHGMMPNHHNTYIGPEDHLFLEDDHGRVELAGDILHQHLLVTGCVLGVVGIQNSQGILNVEGVVFPTPAPQPAMPDPKPQGVIAIISGLFLDEKLHEGVAPYLLKSWLAGCFGDPRAARVSRLVVAGGLVTEPDEKLVGSRVMRPTLSSAALKSCDNLLADIGRTIPVHVMPGSSDPATVAYPQQPLHPALFRRSRTLFRAGGLKLETNPLVLDIEGVRLLGSSGQPIDDLRRYAPDLSTLQLLEETLKWRHLAPSAPDTLWAYPVPDDDPLVIREVPHIYFAANQPSFEVDQTDNTLMISVPKFAQTHQVVLVDLSTLEVDTMTFDIKA